MSCSDLYCMFFFYLDVHHRDLHVLTHSFPTRLSSALRRTIPAGCKVVVADRGSADSVDLVEHTQRRAARVDAVVVAEGRTTSRARTPRAHAARGDRKSTRLNSSH